MATKADVRNRTLKHLGLVAAGQTTPGEYVTTTDAVVQEAHENLTERGVIDWSIDKIPNKAMTDVIRLIALLVGPSLGFGRLPAREEQEQQRLFENGLRQISMTERGNASIEVKYY